VFFNKLWVIREKYLNELVVILFLFYKNVHACYSLQLVYNAECTKLFYIQYVLCFIVNKYNTWNWTELKNVV